MASPIGIGGAVGLATSSRREFAVPIRRSAGRPRASWRPNCDDIIAALRAREARWAASPAFPARESDLIQTMARAIIDDSGEDALGRPADASIWWACSRT